MTSILREEQDASAIAPPITRRSELASGARLIAPLLPGIGVWGLVSGVAMMKAGLTIPQAVGMTFIVYAGSVQLACLPLMVEHAPIGIILVTAAVVNLRFVIYGLGLAPAFRHHPAWRKLALGFLSADTTFVLFVPRSQEEPDRPHLTWLYVGMAFSSWSSWQAMTLVGIALAAHIPTDWGLELAGTLALLALAIPLIVGRAVVAGAIAAAVVAVVGIDWPLRLGLLAAVIVGTGVALLVERPMPAKAPRPDTR